LPPEAEEYDKHTKSKCRRTFVHDQRHRPDKSGRPTADIGHRLRGRHDQEWKKTKRPLDDELMDV